MVEQKFPKYNPTWCTLEKICSNKSTKMLNYFVIWFSVNFPASMIPSEKEQFEEESKLGKIKN